MLTRSINTALNTSAGRFLPKSRDFAVLADSRGALASASFASQTITGTVPGASEASTAIGKRNTGLPFWVDIYSRGSFRLPGNLNFGYSGDTLTGQAGTPGIANRAPACIAACLTASAAGAILFGSTNDLTANVSLAALQGAVLSIVGQFQSAGLLLVICTDTPRGTSAATTYQMTAAQLVTHDAYRRWLINTFRNTPGVIVFDGMQNLLDPTQSTGLWADATLAMTDGLHPSCKGYQRIAHALVDVLSQFFAPQRYNPDDSADIYNATTDPTGFINTNPFLAGTGGATQTGSGGSGTLASNWSVIFNITSRGGLSCAYTSGFAKVDAETGAARTAQRLAYSGSTSSTTLYDGLSQNIDITKYPPGTRVRGAMEMDVLAAPTGVQSIQFGFYGVRSNSPQNQSNLLFMQAFAGQDNAYPMDLSQGIANGLWLTEDFVIPSDVTALSLQLRTTFASGTVAATLDPYWMAAFIAS